MNFWGIFSKNWGKILGGVVGLIVALMVLNYGWKTLLVFAFIALGVFIGWRLDADENFRHFIERLFSYREDH